MRVSDTIEALRPAVEVQTGGTDSAFEYQTLEKVWELLTGETIKDPLTQIYSPTVTISTVYDRCNGTYEPVTSRMLASNTSCAIETTSTYRH